MGLALSVAVTVIVAAAVALAVGFIGFGATIRKHREICYRLTCGICLKLCNYHPQNYKREKKIINLKA